MTPEEKKLINGFMFLSQKPVLYVVNIGESGTLGDDLESAVERYKLTEVAQRPNAGATAICEVGLPFAGPSCCSKVFTARAPIWCRGWRMVVRLGV